MMTSRKVDKIIKNAMLMYEAEAVEEFDSYPDTPVEFSPEFENNMRLLLAENRRKIVRIDRRKRITKLVVAITIAFMMLTAFAAREKIIEFFVEIFEDRTFFSTETNGSEFIEVQYIPQIMPDGYVLQGKIELPKLYSEIWIWKNEIIDYSQRSSKSNDIFIDDEYGTCLEKTVEDFSVYYLEKNNRQLIIWNYDGYNFKLNCPSELDWETITQIITSIAPQE